MVYDINYCLLACRCPGNALRMSSSYHKVARSKLNATNCAPITTKIVSLTITAIDSMLTPGECQAVTIVSHSICLLAMNIIISFMGGGDWVDSTATTAIIIIIINHWCVMNEKVR